MLHHSSPDQTSSRFPGRLERLLLWGIAATPILLLIAAAARGLGRPFPDLPWLSLDGLGLTVGFLVSSVGAATFRFALHHLEGEEGMRRFLRWMALTIVAAILLSLATHLVVFFLAWILTSAGLHQLLTFRRDRPLALLVARKKFLVSRLGDAALLGAIALVATRWDTFDLETLLVRMAADPDPARTTALAVLVALAALAKSAQVPFHTWLPETMEAPAPVSALMHAGIVNAGGLLLLRFAPAIEASAVAQVFLVTVGTATFVLGAMVSWTQPDVKKALAWSTVAQMGFLIVECGLLAWPLAILHLVGHGFYKAWAFLHTGDLPSERPLVKSRSPLADLAAGLPLALAGVAFAAFALGFEVFHSWGSFALTGILVLALSQVPSLLGGFAHRPGASLAGILAGAWIATAIHQIAESLFGLPATGPTPSGLSAAAAAIALVGATLLVLARAILPGLASSPTGARWLVRVATGFQLTTLANRAVERLWTATSNKETRHA